MDMIALGTIFVSILTVAVIVLGVATAYLLQVRRGLMNSLDAVVEANQGLAEQLRFHTTAQQNYQQSLGNSVTSMH